MSLDDFRAILILVAILSMGSFGASIMMICKLSYPIKMDGITYSADTGNSFGFATFTEPREIGGGNVIFPVDWSITRKAAWREEHNIPGAEWQRR